MKSKREVFMGQTTLQQWKKFEKLMPLKRCLGRCDISQVVVNLSSKVLNEVTMEMLTRTLNFAATPTALPVKDFANWIEEAAQKRRGDR